MTRLAICADLHVDDLGSSKIDPTTGWPARFEDGIAAVEFIAEAAVEAGAQALVVAGDYTERRSPAPPRVARIVDALRLGPKRQVHVRGNHDQERSGRSIVDVLGQIEGWAGFTQPGIELVDDVAICAVPFLDRHHLRAYSASAYDEELADGRTIHHPAVDFSSIPDADLFRLLGEQYLVIARGLFVQAGEMGAATTILVGHQQLAGGRMNDTQAAFLGDLDLVVDARALAAIGFDAVIFGHVHKAQTVIDDPACPVMFVGSSHRVDFAEEHDDQRFLILEVAGGSLSIESVPIPARRFVTLQSPRPDDAFNVHDAVVRAVDVDPDVDVAELRRVLEADRAFEVQEIRQRRVEAPEIAGGIAEGLTAPEALETYFADDDDREALVERGRGILAEVAG